MSKASAKCKKCSKTVYEMEMLRTDTDVFHKTCFRCCHCKGQLKLGNNQQPSVFTIFGFWVAREMGRGWERAENFSTTRIELETKHVTLFS